MYASFKVVFFLCICFLPLYSCGKTLNTTTEMKNAHPDSTCNLLEAVIKGDASLVAKILKEKPNLEIKDHKGRTPLMIAAYNNDIEIAELLINAGSDVNAQDTQLNSPFLYAGASGNVEILKLCLENGADFNVYNGYGGTALIPAAERRHLEVVKILTQIPDYPINHINRLGWTALMEAIILGQAGADQVEIVQILVDSGADVSIRDKDGVTPLRHARKRSMNDIVKILLQAGAKN